jgi:hypothetical protein
MTTQHTSSPHRWADLEQAAAELLARSGHCAQATFTVLDEAFDLGGGRTRQSLTLMPGVALRGETCGALLAGLGALGLASSRHDPGQESAFRAAIPAGRQLCRLFEQQFGSTHCGGILQGGLGHEVDVGSRAGFHDYLSCGGVDFCTTVVQATVRLAADLIQAWEEESAQSDSGVMLTV